MTATSFRNGSSYTLQELAELVRRGLKEKGLTQVEAAAYLNAHFEPIRGKYHRPQVSAALTNPDTNPGMVLLMVEAFTDYEIKEAPRYKLSRKE